jgi:ribosomal protein S12 methylthiotransferase accessory factor
VFIVSFKQCADILSALESSRFGRAAPAGDERALGLLRLLGYLSPENGDVTQKNGDEMGSSDRINQIALLNLADQLTRFFQLPLPHGPGALFFGGEVTHSTFGLEKHQPEIIGVGGAGVDPKSAFEACIGEAAEYLSSLEYDNDERITVSAAEHQKPMPSEYRDWVAGGLGNDDWQVETHERWMELEELGGGDKVHFPAELCVRHAENRPDIPRSAESTGCAAGKTYNGALLGGLLEVIERDAIMLWWCGGRNAPTIQKSGLLAGSLKNFSEMVRAGASRQHWFLDLTTDIGVPVIAAVSSEPDGTAIVTGFAAHVSPEIAARKAFLEMCQMELAQLLTLAKRRQAGEQVFGAQDKVWLDRFQSHSIEKQRCFAPDEKTDYPSRDAGGNTLKSVIDSLKNAGLTAFAADLTRPKIGIPATKVVVPGLQSSKPDWISPRLEITARENGVDLQSRLNSVLPI